MSAGFPPGAGVPVPAAAAAASPAPAAPVAVAPAASPSPPPAAAAAAAVGTDAVSSGALSSNAGPGGSPLQPLVLTPMAPPPPPAVPVRVDAASGRVLERVDKPFVYGSAAFWLGKQPEGAMSHKWTVFLRGLENEDLSYFIEKVSFTLHPSFDQHVRVLYHAPYEVTEQGWGEFAIGIRVDFLPAAGLEPVQLSHQLKLFPAPHVAPSTKKPVMSETYDEFVFVQPTKEWYDRLHAGPTRKVDNHPLVHFFTTPEFAREEDQSIEKLTAVNQQVQQSMDEQRARLFALEQEISNLTQKL